MFLGAELPGRPRPPRRRLVRPQPHPEAEQPNAPGGPSDCSRILQIRTIEPGETVGYNATWTAPRRSRIATVAAGYADGYLRSLSNAGVRLCAFDGHPVPLVGRVSMDLATFDVTDHPAASPATSWN